MADSVSEIIELSDPLPGLHTPDQVAKYLKVTGKCVREEIRRGRLEACHVGRKIRITDDQLRAYLEGKS